MYVGIRTGWARGVTAAIVARFAALGGACLTLVLPACAQAPSPPSASDVAMYRGGPAHTGVYDVAGAPAYGGVRWRAQTEGPIRSVPVHVGGRIYLGSADGSLYALDLEGRELWRAPLESAVNSSPAVAGGRVVAQTRSGDIVAVSAADGREIWRRPTGADVALAWGLESGDIYVSSPLVAGDLVVAGSGDGHLYALSLVDGSVRWTHQTGGRVRSSPAMADGVVFVGSMDGRLHAVELATGQPKWVFETDGAHLESGDFGFDRRTIQSSPAVVDGRVYVGARDGFLYCVDAATGAELWRVDHQASWVNTSPAVWNGLVYAGSSDARFVQALDAASGAERWRIPTNGPVWSAPVVASGTLYFGDGVGTLYAVDAATGTPRWTHWLAAGIRAGALPVADMVLVGGEDGALHAVGSNPSGRNLQRLVFWDSAYVRAAWLRGSDGLRDYLAGRGYGVVAEDSLAGVLRGAIADGTAAEVVVVFAIDHLPQQLADTAQGAPLLRRFLDAGGKVVWPGTPPMLWVRDPATGSPGSYAAIDRSRARRLLDVDFAGANFDRWGSTVTSAGERWGLSGWWTAPWGVAPDRVTEVLAVDENGLAPAWARSFGGRPGSGFVMIGRGPGPWTDAEVVRAVAEHYPR